MIFCRQRCYGWEISAGDTGMKRQQTFGRAPIASRKITPERDGATNIKITLTKKRDFDPGVFLAKAGLGRTIIKLDNKERAFSQGDAAASVFYIQSGRMRLSVIAKTGKEATLALLGPGDFCGEECIALAHPLRAASASAITPCTLLKIERKEMMRALHQEHAFSDIFVAHLLARNARVQEDLGRSAF
jgi:CRP/FNR family cyclic AMP-dependent transcriptional regulator